jgi:hypothetical protein
MQENLYLCKMVDNIEVDLDDSKENFKAMMEISESKPYAVLVDARVHCSITKEAMEHSTRPESSTNLIANAIMVDSLANRILGNFLIRMSRNHAPTKLFTEEQKALEWLHEMIKKEKIKKPIALSL